LAVALADNGFGMGDRLALYPHEVEMVETIPQTVTGKILRRSLRASAKPTSP
jgi:acyl-coenzyme A synthetase/AMP-(fatty) acid ligase